jgi:hypothetical protein
MVDQNFAGTIKAMLRFTIGSLSIQSSNHTAIHFIYMRVILFLLCPAAIVLLYSRDIPRRQKSPEPVSGTDIGAIADENSADDDSSLGSWCTQRRVQSCVPRADDAEIGEDETDKEVWRTPARLKSESITDKEELTLRVISQIAPFDIPIQKQWTLSGSEQQVDKQVSPRVFQSVRNLMEMDSSNSLFKKIWILQNKGD